MIRDTAAMDRPAQKTRSWTRRWPWLAAAAVFLVAILVALPGMRRWLGTERAVSAAQLRFATVAKGDLVREISAQGNVIAASRPNLTSPARGTAAVLVRAGEVVEEDQILVRIESPEVESRLRQEQSTVEAFRADLERQRLLAQQAEVEAAQQIRLLEVGLEAARRAMSRAQQARDEGILNEVEYERAQDDLAMAELRLEVARKQAELDVETRAFEVQDRRSRLERQRLLAEDVERQVGELEVRSPVSGLVARLEVDDGDSVTEGEPLVSVVDLSELQVEVMIPESYAPEVLPGTEARILHAGRELPGEVVSISPEVQGSRVRGIVAFRGEVPEGLKQNQRVSTRLILGSRTDVLKVERGPFVEAGGGRRAWVVEDGVAVRRPIEIGSVSVTEVEIVSGLEVGERIVVSDTSRFENAERVLLTD